MLANVCKSDVNVCKWLQMFANGCKCLQMSVMVTRRAFPGCGRFRERIPGVAAGAHCAVPLHMQSAGENKCKWLCKYQQSRANVCKCLQMFAGCLQMFVSVCQWLRDTCECLPMIAGYMWMFANGCKCLQMSANACKCLANVCKWFCKWLQMLANVCKCLQMHVNETLADFASECHL